MEKNIHDNEFDDYVRRSFDSYEELPADDMWERVETQLQPDDKKRRPVIWWWVNGLAAAALIVTGWLNVPSDHASEIQPAANNTILQPEKMATAAGALAPENKVVTNTSIVPEVKKQQASPSKQQNMPVKTPVTSTLSTVAAHENKPQTSVHHHPDDAVNNAATNPTSSTGMAAGSGSVENTGLDVSADPTNTVDAIASNNQIPNLRAEVVEKSSPVEPAFNPDLLTFSMLPHKQQVVQEQENQFFTPDQIFNPIQLPDKKISRFYLGLSFTPLRFTDKTHFTPPSAAGRIRVASFTQKAQPSADWWLKAGGYVTRRWGWESGIGYRSVSRRAIHFPRFRFQQGVLATTAPPRNYDFTYNLDTYGGSAEVTVRMEQQDNNPQVSPNEAVSLKVLTQENVEILRVPFLFTAQMGKGRLKAVIKGGLTGSYILSNKIDFRSRISTSTRFRVGNAHTVYPELNNRFFLGYQVSAGLSYRVLPQWSLVMEPVFAGDFSRKTRASTKLPELRSYGLNMGINHHF